MFLRALRINEISPLANAHQDVRLRFCRNTLHTKLVVWIRRIAPLEGSRESKMLMCSSPPGGIYTRFMRLAANPAPKPLSMLTTVTPAAQELSIPNNAASPLKLAP